MQCTECALQCLMCCPKSKSCSSLLPYEYIRKAKHTPNSTVSVLLKALCTLEMKPKGVALIELCIMHYAPETMFS